MKMTIKFRQGPGSFFKPQDAVEVEEVEIGREHFLHAAEAFVATEAKAGRTRNGEILVTSPGGDSKLFSVRREPVIREM